MLIAEALKTAMTASRITAHINDNWVILSFFHRAGQYRGRSVAVVVGRYRTNAGCDRAIRRHEWWTTDKRFDSQSSLS
jgi:hypothetical protein